MDGSFVNGLYVDGSNIFRGEGAAMVRRVSA